MTTVDHHTTSLLSQTTHGKSVFSCFSTQLLTELGVTRQVNVETDAQSISDANVFSSSAMSNSESIFVTNDVVCLPHQATTEAHVGSYLRYSLLRYPGTLYSNAGPVQICYLFYTCVTGRSFRRILMASAYVV